MAAKLSEAIVTTIKDAARQLRGQGKRAFQAKVAKDYLHGSARRAETVFGWGREAVFKGLEELDGSPVPGKADQIPGGVGRGRPRTEQRLDNLEADVRSLVEPRSQADPKFQSAFAYTRMTAANVRRALIDEKGYRPDDLPGDRTLRRILNRFGFRLRRVQKTKPVKKIKERCWGVLEMHRNGTLLDTIEKAVHWAETMTRKGVRPMFCLLDRVYQLGVRLTKAALRPYCEHVCRSASLPKWSVAIHPQPATVRCDG